MIGTRPITPEEYQAILQRLPEGRDQLLFTLLYFTGFRIQEALSLRAQDVARGRCTVTRRNMKGKERSRSVLMHPHLRAEVYAYIGRLNLQPQDFLFTGVRTGKPIGRCYFWRLVKDAALSLGLRGPVALHSTRKSFAHAMYKHFDKDLVKTAQALGHTQVNTTAAYLKAGQPEIDAAISALPVPSLPSLGA